MTGMGTDPVDSRNPVLDGIDLPLREGVPAWAHPARRVDPFYSGWWTGSDAFYWSSGEQTRRALAGARPGRGLPALPPLDTAWGRLLDGDRVEVTGAVAGVVLSYRTVTVEQLAGLSGYACTSKLMDVVWTMHAAGIVDLGRRARLTGRAEGWRTLGVRPSKGRAWHRRLLTGLPLSVRWAMTAGKNLRTGGQYARHNLLTSELLLRLASYHDVVVGGESLALVKDLVGDHHANVNRSADGILVRRDGARVAVETTASAAHNLLGKVARWVEALHTGPAGLAVVFLDAAPVGANPRSLAYMKRMIARALDQGYSSPWFAQATARVFAASWPVWFAPDGPTSRFARLTVERYETSTGRWQPVDLIGEAAVLDGSGCGPWLGRGLSSSYATPPWSRRDPYPLWALGPIGLHAPIPAAPRGAIRAGLPDKLMPARATSAVTWARRNRPGR